MTLKAKIQIDIHTRAKIDVHDQAIDLRIMKSSNFNRNICGEKRLPVIISA